MKTQGWEQIYKQEGEVQSEVLPKIKKYVKIFKKRGVKKILDLGCGTGRHSIYLAKEDFFVYATDISKTGLEIARKKAKSLNLKNIKFKRHDMRRIPHPNNFFDAVICVWTIGHGVLADIQKTVNEIYRILRSDGLVITDFASVADKTYGTGKEIEKNTFLEVADWEKDTSHHYSTKNEIAQLFSKFKQTKIQAVNYSYMDNKNKKHIIKAFDVEAIK